MKNRKRGTSPEMSNATDGHVSPSAFTEVMISPEECHAHGAVFVPKALLMTFIWHFFTASDKKRDLRHAYETLCHEIIASTIVPLLVLIPVLCLCIAFCDWKEKKTSHVPEDPIGDISDELCVSRLGEGTASRD